MRNLVKTFSISSLLLATSAAWSVETERQLSLDASNLEAFTVDVGAGSLSIQGKPNATKIEVTAKITVDRVDQDEAQEWFKDNMKLSLENIKGRAVLCATFSYSSHSNCSIGERKFVNWGWKGERKIDLVVTMPQNLKLDVDDGSGSIEVSNINADTFIDDGSGDMTISNIAANLRVDDGSGDLTVIKVNGGIYIDDGSGSLSIDQVTGEVEIKDGSGDIKIINVDKKVYIDDGSGSITACHLGGDLTVDDGSGKVNTCDDIKGQVVVK